MPASLSNPIASDLDALRPSVLPSLLAAASRNAARGFANLQLFEIGAAFDSGVPAQQKTVAAAIRSGAPSVIGRKASDESGLFDVKADLLAALEAITGASMSAPIAQGAPAWYHPGRSGTIAMGPKVIAQFGEIHPKVLAAFDLKGPAAGFEIFLDAIPDAKSKVQQGQAAVRTVALSGHRARFCLRGRCQAGGGRNRQGG
jgi:phenylalanyl-tRNA synthetase beta chain